MNLNQITVSSADVATSVRFYRELGLLQIVEDLPKYARFECPEGGATFSVHYAEHVQPNAGTVIYFECENLDAVVAGLKSKGIKFEADPQDQPWLWREAYLRDPDDNVICLYHAGHNRQNPPWRINRPAPTSDPII